MKWYKRDPDAFKGGTIGLTLEEVGAYTLLLDDIYARDGAVPDNEMYCCRLLRCDPRVWRRVRARLIEAGKIQTTGVLLSNFRATSEISSAKVRLMLARSLNEKRWKNNGRGPPHRYPPTEDTTTTTAREEEKKAYTYSKRASLRSAACTIPESFVPDRELARSKGWPESKIDEQAASFRDHALSKGRLAKDWPAAWRNWVRSSYQNQNGNGVGNGSERSVLAAADRQIEYFRQQGATGDYVPGSSGPQPLRVDIPVGPNGPKLISSR